VHGTDTVRTHVHKRVVGIGYESIAILQLVHTRDTGGHHALVEPGADYDFTGENHGEEQWKQSTRA
jgi:hypothetical protein